ncbi:unnamed protein product [Nippostrongylus brasiliensis]|uniref:Uncharacterized protein n=1 Tax=Nippostrongylus brasiliensis TaxID=27835 RepID=A0A0N4YC79_NIPBR|nr:unnamed protein product [Nippostrongylus brasiliensis]
MTTSPLSLSLRNRTSLESPSVIREINFTGCRRQSIPSRSPNSNSPPWYEPIRATTCSSWAVRTPPIQSASRGTPPRPRSITLPTTSNWPHQHPGTNQPGKRRLDDGASTSAVILWSSVMLNFIYMLYFISGRLGDED